MMRNADSMIFLNLLSGLPFFQTSLKSNNSNNENIPTTKPRYSANSRVVLVNILVINSPIEIGAVSNLLANYANIAYRIGKPFEVDAETGRIFDREAMKLWSRNYEPGWEPVY